MRQHAKPDRMWCADRHAYLSAAAAYSSCAYRLPVSEGVLVNLLGLVVVATSPGRFWFGFALAVVPIAVGLVLKTYDSACGHPR